MNFQFTTENLLRLIVFGLIFYFLYQCLTGKVGKKKKSNKSIKETWAQFGGNIMKTGWINKPYGYGYGDDTPATGVNELVKKFGEPDEFNPESGGGAVWDAESLEGTPYVRIEIRDEQVPRRKPVPHVDFIYSFYRVDVPANLINGLDKISKSISYDPAQSVMGAGGNDMRANVVTHWIVKHYANGKLTIDEAVNMHGPMVAEIMKDETGVKVRELEREL